MGSYGVDAIGQAVVSEEVVEVVGRLVGEQEEDAGAQEFFFAVINLFQRGKSKLHSAASSSALLCDMGLLSYLDTIGYLGGIA